MRNNLLIRRMIRFLKENGLNDDQIKEVKADLKEMEIEATEKELSLEEFLGKDYRQFCIELLNVGYDFEPKEILSNDKHELMKIYREILVIMIPSIIISLLTLTMSNYIFLVYISIEITSTAVLTYTIMSRDKEKYNQFKKEFIYTNVIAFLVTLFFALPSLNTNMAGIFGNHYNGIYESLIVQWVRVIDYIEVPPFIQLNENIIIVNDYLFSFSLVLLFGYSFYTYLFKRTQVKYFMIPLAVIALFLALLEYFTTFQIPFMGVFVFIYILYFYLQQYKQLEFKDNKYLLYGIGGFFVLTLLVLLLVDIEFIPRQELYYGNDLIYLIKLALLFYLGGIGIYALINIKKIDSIKRFYSLLNLFIIAYGSFMLMSYIYQGIEHFNLNNPLTSWQSIRIVNQMAFAAFWYYTIDSLIRRFGNLDNND